MNNEETVLKDNYDKPLFYSLFIDPLLKNIREKVLTFIEEDKNLIDISCGTGSFSRILSKKCRNVTGVDISQPMISFAEEKSRREKIINTNFINKDILTLEKEKLPVFFDYALLSMAVHQFNEKQRILILEKAQELAERVIILDYSCPVRPPYIKAFINSIEYLAGREHFYNFKSYNSEKGIRSILEEYNFKNIINHDAENSVFSIVSYGKNI